MASMAAYSILFFILLLFLASAPVWRDAAVRISRGMPLLDWHDRRPTVWPYLPVILLFVYLGYVIFGWFRPGDAAAPKEIDSSTLAVLALNIALMWGVLLISIVTGSAGAETYGITFRRLWSQVLDGVRGYLLSWLPVVLVLVTTAPFRSPEALNPLLQLLAETRDWGVIALIAFTAVVLAPLSEELLFRVVLQGWLETRIGPQWAIGIASVLFASVHGWPDMLPLLPLAVLLGYVFWRRHSYVAIVVMHSLFNAVMLVLSLLAQAAGEK